MIRVFLIEDHELVRTGFRLILSREIDIEVVGEAASGEEALVQLKQQPADVALCDLYLSGMSGLEVTERLVRSQLPTRIIMVSSQSDGPMPKRLLEAGAAGYLSKGCPADELLRAVRDVARGKRFLSADIARQLALSPSQGKQSPFDLLSPREMEITLMLTKGQRMSDIARRLNLSAKTVATHKYRVFDKLGVRDAVNLANMVREYGISDSRRVVLESMS